jgi:hypothetical protein
MVLWHTSSQLRGAKQLVVETTQATFETPRCWMAASMASQSVTNASPCCLGSMTTGRRFADTIALRHVFWSILLHTTYLHFNAHYARSMVMRCCCKRRGLLHVRQAQEGEVGCTFSDMLQT